MMSKMHFYYRIIATCAALAAVSPVATAGQSTYEKSLEAWKAERLSFLKSAEGYLNLVGLHWLRKPRSTFGSSAESDLVFPAGSPPIMGEFFIVGDTVMLKVADGVEVLQDGARVRELEMDDDSSNNPVVATHGSLAWTIIKRDQQFAVRVRDFAHAASQTFPGIDYFPPNQDFRVTARMVPYAEPRRVRVNTVIEGLEYKPTSPGTVRFELSGKSYDLEAYNTNQGLLFVFGDLTTGMETYPAGRFLYTEAPDADGRVVLDFNRAENPPCAFNEFATCPVAAPRNRLAVAIPAGERFDPAKH